MVAKGCNMYHVYISYRDNTVMFRARWGKIYTFNWKCYGLVIWLCMQKKLMMPEFIEITEWLTGLSNNSTVVACKFILLSVHHDMGILVNVFVCSACVVD